MSIDYREGFEDRPQHLADGIHDSIFALQREADHLQARFEKIDHAGIEEAASLVLFEELAVARGHLRHVEEVLRKVEWLEKERKE